MNRNSKVTKRSFLEMQKRRWKREIVNSMCSNFPWDDEPIKGIGMSIRAKREHLSKLINRYKYQTTISGKMSGKFGTAHFIIFIDALDAITSIPKLVHKNINKYGYNTNCLHDMTLNDDIPIDGNLYSKETISKIKTSCILLGLKSQSSDAIIDMQTWD